MKKKTIAGLIAVVVIASVVAFSGCISESDKWVTIHDEHVNLKDGDKISWSPELGEYYITINSDEEVNVGIWNWGDWIQYVEEVTSYEDKFWITHDDGRIMIENPSSSLHGPIANIHVILEKRI